MDLTPDVKMMIDGMSYGKLLEKWRFAPAGDPLFTGESGQYYAEVMKDRREHLPAGAHAAISRCLAIKEGLHD